MDAYSVISLTPTTKEQAETFAQKLISEVEEGNVNPLQLQIQLTAMQKAMDSVKKKIADLVLTEAQKHGQKTFTIHSAQVEISELGTKYWFGDCNDPEWTKANEEELKWGDKRKERELFLKALKHSTTLLDEESGEVIKIHPPVKSSTTGIKVTLK